ncbi:hypothetical protein MDA_GLEAN10020872 [Myotis davidii]|uniref:Uncharacterized protein n=1 Tax=Myotis davidii TaxID=225400 RepID=L5M262_MYODS|nr:hypothetical protein MDA_GLEAN10020872 [Myotis davidii]
MPQSHPALTPAASASPTCTYCQCQSHCLHPLPALGAGPNHLVLSAGVSGGRPQSSLRASPPPPAPEGQLRLAVASRTRCQHQPHLHLLPVPEPPLTPAAGTQSQLLGVINGWKQRLSTLIVPEGFSTSPCS